MGSNGRPVGPRGAALLAVAAVVGIVLAVHGWSGRHSGLASPPSASRGYHELVQPSLWTGYVPAVPAASGVAVVLVLAHGWLLLVLAVALIAGIGPRAAAAAAAVLLLEIVVWLTVTGGLSDLTLRDLGVLGLAVCLTGRTRQRLVLRG